MSTRSKAKRATTRRPAAAPKTGAGQPPALARAVMAQKRLDQQAEAFRKAQESRRKEVRVAFESGVTIPELIEALGVSRAKVYDLLGGIKSKTDRSPTAAS